MIDDLPELVCWHWSRRHRNHPQGCGIIRRQVTASIKSQSDDDASRCPRRCRSRLAIVPVIRRRNIVGNKAAGSGLQGVAAMAGPVVNGLRFVGAVLLVPFLAVVVEASD